MTAYTAKFEWPSTAKRLGCLPLQQNADGLCVLPDPKRNILVFIANTADPVVWPIVPGAHDR